jgi:hypothetical protein
VPPATEAIDDRLYTNCHPNAVRSCYFAQRAGLRRRCAVRVLWVLRRHADIEAARGAWRPLIGERVLGYERKPSRKAVTDCQRAEPHRTQNGNQKKTARIGNASHFRAVKSSEVVYDG